MTRIPTLALLLGSTMLAACGEDDAPPSDEPQPPAHAAAADTASPAADEPRARMSTAGTYALASDVTVEAVALLPASAHQGVLVLEGLRDHPARTLFDLAEAAGVPAVGTLRAALPGALESRLEGWIDARVRAVTTGDGTLADVIAAVSVLAHAEVGALHLGSHLSLADDGARHRLDSVALEVAGQVLAYDVAPLATVGVELDVATSATVVHERTGADLTLGAHGFGLPYGRLAWRALDDLVRARFGRDLRALLGAQVDCAGVAATVADQCVLGACVGHEAELTTICEAGLDRAVAELRTRVEAAALTPFTFAGGQARLVDGAPVDGVASRLTDGLWDAQLDLGVGPRPAPATFTGERE